MAALRVRWGTCDALWFGKQRRQRVRSSQDYTASCQGTQCNVFLVLAAECDTPKVFLVLAAESDTPKPPPPAREPRRFRPGG